MVRQAPHLHPAGGWRPTTRPSSAGSGFLADTARPVRPAGAQKPQSWGRPEPPGPRPLPPRREPDCFFPVRRSGGGGARRGRRGGRASPRPERPGPRGGGAGATPGGNALRGCGGRRRLRRAAGAIFPAFLPAPSSSGGLSRRLQVCVWGVELRGHKTRPFPLSPRLLILSRGEALPSNGPFSAFLSEHFLEPSLLRMDPPSLNFPSLSAQMLRGEGGVDFGERRMKDIPFSPLLPTVA